MIKPVFKNIQNAIQAELFKASYSIKIAVAWFTNDLLYQVLLLKLQTGVSVELILNDDDINRKSEHHLDFTPFVKLGGKIHWVKDKNLMHQKFCIIDDNVVINGSYNWTYKAEYNNENVIITTDEYEFAKGFVYDFTRLSRLYPKQNIEKKECYITQPNPAPPKTTKKKGIPMRYLQVSKQLVFYDELSYLRLYNGDTGIVAKLGDYYCTLNKVSMYPEDDLLFESIDELLKRKNNDGQN